MSAEPTYAILDAGMTLLCFFCNSETHDAYDVNARYCPRCHWCHDQAEMFGGRPAHETPYPD